MLKNMKKMKINNRKCIVTNKTFPKKELIRIVKLKNNTYEVDSSSPGRGAYVKRDKTIFDEILKKKLLNRAFKTNVPLEVYDRLKKIILEED